jgi:hypothetical protein
LARVPPRASRKCRLKAGGIEPGRAIGRSVPAGISMANGDGRWWKCTRSRAEGDSRSAANKVRQDECRSSRHGPSGNRGSRVGVVGPTRARGKKAHSLGRTISAATISLVLIQRQ